MIVYRHALKLISQSFTIIVKCKTFCFKSATLALFIKNYRLYDYDKTFSTVEISLAALPSERYKRNVVRGKLDLVGK